MIAQRLRLPLAGLAAFLIALPFYLPASLLVNLLGDRIPTGFVWQQVDGSIFAPRLYQAGYRNATGAGLIFSRVDAQLSVLPLFMGRLGLRFELYADGHRVSGNATVSRRRWELAQVHGSLPISMLLSWLPVGSSGLDGVFALDITRLSGNRAGLPDMMDLAIDFKQLRATLDGVDYPLGDHQLKLAPDPQTSSTVGSLTTPDADAPLQVDANISLDPAERLLQIEGRAVAAPAAGPAVQQLLPLFGQVENDTAHLRWRIPL